MAWIRERKTRDGRRRVAIQWRDDTGRVRSETLPTTDPRLVDMHLRIAQRREGKPGAALDATDPLNALDAFLEERDLSVSAPSIAQYREKIQPMFRAWADAPMSSWRRTMLVRYITGKDWSPRSTQILVCQARQFIRWAASNEIPCPDFVGDFKGPKVRMAERKTLTLRQVRTLLDKPGNRRLRLPVALAAFAGLSQADIYALDWREVRLDEERDGHAGWIVRRRSKTGQEIRIPIIPPIRDILTEQLAVRRGPVCRLPMSTSSLRKSLQRARTRAGIPAAPKGQGGWHAFRHSLGTVLGELGVHQAVIARVLAHAPGSTMAARYIHPDDSQVAAAMSQLGDAFRSAERPNLPPRSAGRHE